MHDGGITIVDEKNPNVLSFVRTASDGANPVLVMLNMTSTPQTTSIDLRTAKVAEGKPHTLLSSPGQKTPANLDSVNLAPYSVWIGEIQ